MYLSVTAKCPLTQVFKCYILNMFVYFLDWRADQIFRAEKDISEKSCP